MESPAEPAAPRPDAVGAARRGGAVLLALAAHLFVAAVATWPLLGAPTTRLVGDPRVDVWNHAWGPWWFATTIGRGDIPLATQMLGAPVGGRLWYIDPIGALLGAPLVGPLGPAAAYNTTIFAAVLLASVAGRRLSRALGASEAGAWLAAVATACSPYLLSEVHNGVSEACWIGWSVLALGSLARAARPEGRAWDWATTGLWGGVTAVGTVYYALGLALVATPIVLVELVRTRGRALPGVLLGAAVAALTAAPALRGAAWTLADDAHTLVHRDYGHWSDRMSILAHNAVDLRSFILPGFQSVDLTPLGEHFLHSSFAGWLVLGAVLFARRRAWVFAALVGLVFSLGPFLWWGADFVRYEDRLVRLPAAVFLEILPASIIGHPQRMGAPGLAVLAALAGVAVSRLSPRWIAGLTALCAAELLAASPWPTATAAFPDEPVALRIRADAVARAVPEAVVLDLPGDAPGQGMLPSRYLFAQAFHGQPIPYVPDARTNTNRLASTHGVSALLDAAVSGNGVASLAKEGVGWVVLHPDIGDVALAEERLTAWLGAPEVHGDARMWIVPNPRPRQGPKPTALKPPWRWPWVPSGRASVR